MNPVWLAIALAAAAPSTDEVADLRKQLADQRALIQDLQNTTAALEKRLESAPASPVTTHVEDHAEHGLKKPRGGFVIQGKAKKVEPASDVEAAKNAIVPPAPAPAPKLLIKTLMYADYGKYTHAGFGPQFFDDGTRFPGPGNNGFDAFEVTRAYLNFYFSPNPQWTLRITPDIYRDVATATADKVGAIAGFGANADQQPNFRLKYAFVDYNDLFRHDEHLKGAKVRFGQQMNPLVDWEEHLYGYRYTSLTPWNYVSLSSTQAGIAMKGPLRFGEGNQVRGDYDLGVYNEGKFSQIEFSDQDQVMARVSIYPWGLKGTDEGMGFTFFGDWGASNTVPDLNANTGLYRDAFIAHYNTRQWSLAAEFDYGRNAFATGNLFSAVGPQDQFGIGVTGFANTDALAKALLDTPQSHQRGWAGFGHYRIGKSPFDLFALMQWFEPNTAVASDPFNFRRSVAGVSWQPAEFVRFSLNDQTFEFPHDPYLFPAARIAPFSSALAAKNPGGIQTGSLGSVNALFFNMEFFY